MVYTLPNGQVIELSTISSVSSIRDYGHDPKSIDKHMIGFTIRLKGREIVEVTENYHFSDWSEVKKRVKQLREDIIALWQEDVDKSS
jgi:UDP-N-acetylmuramate-alanine ligase